MIISDVCYFVKGYSPGERANLDKCYVLGYNSTNRNLARPMEGKWLVDYQRGEFRIYRVPKLRNEEGHVVVGTLQEPWPLGRLQQINFIFGEKGKIGGGHYHLGEDPSKSPEKLFVTEGPVDLDIVHPDGHEETHNLNPGPNEVVVAAIPIFTWHQTTCRRPGPYPAKMIELRVVAYNSEQPDTVKCTKADFKARIGKLMELCQQHEERSERDRERDAMAV